jgi:hypothetical protein
LYILPLWFAILGLMFFLITYKNSGYKRAKVLFREKVANERVLAEDYKRGK